MHSLTPSNFSSLDVIWSHSVLTRPPVLPLRVSNCVKQATPSVRASDVLTRVPLCLPSLLLGRRHRYEPPAPSSHSLCSRDDTLHSLPLETNHSKKKNPTKNTSPGGHIGRAMSPFLPVVKLCARAHFTFSWAQDRFPPQPRDREHSWKVTEDAQDLHVTTSSESPSAGRPGLVSQSR